MDSVIHDLLLTSLGLLLKTGLPLFFVLVFVFFSGKSYLLNRTWKASNPILILGVALATGLWIFLYGEHYSHGAIPLFDMGAPMFSLLALIVFPAIGIFHALFARKPARKKYDAISIVSAYVLLFLSLVPGIYMVWFYGAAFYSDR